MARQSAILQIADKTQEQLWRDALGSQDIPVVDLAAGERGIVNALKGDSRTGRARLLITDIAHLRADRIAAPALARWLANEHPGLQLACILARPAISGTELGWEAKKNLQLLPQGSRRYWRESVLPMLERIAPALTGRAADAGRLAQALGSGLAGQGQAGPVDAAWAIANSLHTAGVDWRAIGTALHADRAALLQDRQYRTKTYRECLVASEAVTWMVDKFAVSRDAAVAVGAALTHFGVLHHSMREQDFRDEFLFFRCDGHADAASEFDLDRCAHAMRESWGLSIVDRVYRNKTYPACFVGSDAVDWMMRRYGLTVGEAEAVGQSLVDVGIIHHVADDHGFVDAEFFYRFYKDE